MGGAVCAHPGARVFHIGTSPERPVSYPAGAAIMAHMKDGRARSDRRASLSVFKKLDTTVFSRKEPAPVVR
jgi:hypothetical protein